MAKTPTLHQVKVLRAVDVALKVSLSRRTVFRLVRSGKFPAPIRLGTNSVGWLEHQVDEWILNRPAA